MSSRPPMFVSLAGDAIITADGHVHPEPVPPAGGAAPAWNRCRIAGCTHQPACPAKLRAWARYGRRYICDKERCDHRDCPPRRRADEDGQAFGVPYKGPALPQHIVDTRGRPLGPSMRAIQDADGDWHLVPIGPLSPVH